MYDKIKKLIQYQPSPSMKTSSVLYEQKPQTRQQLKNIVSHVEISHSNVIKNQKCVECGEYQSLVLNLENRLKQSIKKEKKLKNMLDKLEAQNSSMVLNTDHAVKDFEEHIIKLQNQILERDEIISRLADEIDNINNASESLSEAVAQQKYKIQEIEQAHRAQIAHFVHQNNEFKLHIIRQVSQKAAMQRKFKEDERRWDVESYKLKEQINSMNEQIEQKQRLIKSLSDSNNELRIEMINLKSKLEVEDLAWSSSNKKNLWMNDSQATVRQLKNENQQLKIMNKGLQIELQFLVRQTEEIETALVKIKLERDILRKTVERSNEKRLEQRQAGRIMHNSEIKNKACWPGLIRFSKTAHTSIGSSVTNEITEERDSIDD